MIVFTVIGILVVAIGAPFLALNLVMMRRDNRELRKHRAQSDPAEEFSPLPPSRLKPHVPPQWQPTGEDLRDIPPHSTDL